MCNATRSAALLGGLLIVSMLFPGSAVRADPPVRFEHLAINVANPKIVADWYVKYMDLRILSSSRKMIFVTDPGHHFMFEFYNKPNVKGSFSDLSHDAAHVAFATADADGLEKKLVEGGATMLRRFMNPVGDTVINMRDPWGNSLQIIQRVKSKL